MWIEKLPHKILTFVFSIGIIKIIFFKKITVPFLALEIFRHTFCIFSRFTYGLFYCVGARVKKKNNISLNSTREQHFESAVWI